MELRYIAPFLGLSLSGCLNLFMSEGTTISSGGTSDAVNGGSESGSVVVVAPDPDADDFTRLLYANGDAGTYNIVGDCDEAASVSIEVDSNATVSQAYACSNGRFSVGVSFSSSTSTTRSVVFRLSDGREKILQLSVFHCPDGYVKVTPTQSALVNAPFCVMKYEAKYGTNGLVTSKAAALPVRNLSYTDSAAACHLGTGYSLISNSEWLTIAHEVASVTANWVEDPGAPGTYYLARGVSDNLVGTPVAASTDDTNGYANTTTTAAAGTVSLRQQRRTMTLPDGGVIWDMAGNADEWIALSLNVGKPTAGAYPAALSALTPTTEMPTSSYMPLLAGLTSALGAGVYHKTAVAPVDGNTSPTAAPDFAIRGGDYNDFSNSGIYGLYFKTATGSAEIGFRCVYRPLN